MEAISYLVPELRSETHRRRATQVFEKTQCLRILSCYGKSIHVLVKRQLEIQQRHLKKTALVKAGAYIVSIDIKTTVYNTGFRSAGHKYIHVYHICSQGHALINQSIW